MAKCGMGDPSKPGRSPRSPQWLDLKRENDSESAANHCRDGRGGKPRWGAIDGSVIPFLAEFQSIEDKFLP
jgi:hypothetical protein